jgi:hypothetical protein
MSMYFCDKCHHYGKASSRCTQCANNLSADYRVWIRDIIIALLIVALVLLSV